MTGVIITISKEELQELIIAAVQSGIDQYEVLKENTEDSDKKIFLKYPDAAKFLQISVSKLRNLAAKKEIHFIQDQRCIYFLQQDLENWLLSKRKKTAMEEEAEAEEKLERFFNKNVNKFSK